MTPSDITEICCGDELKELKAGTVDASAEKHVPSYQLKDGKVYVNVGEVAHPMEADHFIEWIALFTDKGTYFKNLSPDDKPEAVFSVDGGEHIEEIYAYCNLHKLWKA